MSLSLKKRKKGKKRISRIEKRGGWRRVRERKGWREGGRKGGGKRREGRK